MSDEERLTLTQVPAEGQQVTRALQPLAIVARDLGSQRGQTHEPRQLAFGRPVPAHRVHERRSERVPPVALRAGPRDTQQRQWFGVCGDDLLDLNGAITVGIDIERLPVDVVRHPGGDCLFEDGLLDVPSPIFLVRHRPRREIVDRHGLARGAPSRERALQPRLGVVTPADANEGQEQHIRPEPDADPLEPPEARRDRVRFVRVVERRWHRGHYTRPVGTACHAHRRLRAASLRAKMPTWPNHPPPSRPHP